eukprot:347379_1
METSKNESKLLGKKRTLDEANEPPTKKSKTNDSPSPLDIQITVVLIKDYEEITLNVQLTNTIKDIKDMIRQKKALSPSIKQQVTFKFVKQSDEKSVSDCKIENGSKLRVKYIKDISTSQYDVITQTFLVNGIYKDYMVNKSMKVSTFIKKIYDDCNLSKFSFPWFRWKMQIKYFSYIQNNEQSISDHLSSGEIIKITNSSYPNIPLRDQTFKKWLNGENNMIPETIGYPVTLMNGQYRMMSKDDRLRFATVWLDVDVAQKLIGSNVIDINVKDESYQWTPLNLLSSGNMYSNISYDARESDWLRLVEIFCQNKNIELETFDVFGRSPLANAVRYQKIKIAKILLRFGACVDESVLKEINDENGESKKWIWNLLTSKRSDYNNNLKSVLEMYHCENVLDIVLDYFLCPMQY